MPSKLELIDKISEYLCLNTKEKYRLEEYYHIARLGKSVYYRRKAVYKFVKDFSSNFIFNTRGDSQPQIPSSTFHPCADTVWLKGKNDINQAILNLFMLETNSGGSIDILIQPDYKFLFDLAKTMGVKNPNLSIRHVLCLTDNESEATIHPNYNLDCLSTVLTLCKCKFKYEVYYYHNNIDKQLHGFIPFSYFLVTTEYAILLSHNIEYGIFLQNPTLVERVQELFNNCLKDTFPLFEQFENVFSECDKMTELKFGDSAGVSFQEEPCLVPLMQEQYLWLLNTDTKFIFTKKGILQFINTGRLLELPPESCLPFDMKDRLYLLKRLISFCEKNKYYMLREDAQIVPSDLCIYVNSSTGYLLFKDYKGTLTYLTLKESRLVNAFYDCLNTLEEYRNLMTKEDTLKFLNHII